MAAIFRKANAADASLRICIYGASGAGKSHFGASAPEPAFLDFEHRAASFADRFGLQICEPTNMVETVAAIEAIQRGDVPCRTVVADSLSVPYQRAVARFTKAVKNKDGSEAERTDYVSVNKVMAKLTSELLAIRGKHIIAIVRQAARLEREGNDFKKAGVKMAGDGDRWVYDYDYVLHFAGRGVIYVEKSMSAHLPVGTNLRRDMDFARFVRLVRGEESLDGQRRSDAATGRGGERGASAPVPAGAPGDPLDQDLGHRGQRAEPAPIDKVLAHLDEAQAAAVKAAAKGLTPGRVVLLAASITGAIGVPLDPVKLPLLIGVLEKDERAA